METQLDSASIWSLGKRKDVKEKGKIVTSSIDIDPVRSSEFSAQMRVQMLNGNLLIGREKLLVERNISLLLENSILFSKFCFIPLNIPLNFLQ